MVGGKKTTDFNITAVVPRREFISHFSPVFIARQGKN